MGAGEDCSKSSCFFIEGGRGLPGSQQNRFLLESSKSKEAELYFQNYCMLPRPYRDSRQDMGKSFLNVSNALVLLLAAIVIAHSPEEKLTTRHDSQNHKILGKLNEELIIKLVALSQLCSRKVSF